MDTNLIIEIDQLNNFAWKEKYSNHELSLEKAQQALKLSKEIQYKRGENYSILFTSAIQFLMSLNENEILKNLILSFEYFENHPEEIGNAISLSLLGNVYDSYGDYEKGIYYCQKAIKAAELINYQEGIADSCSTLGMIYHRMSDFKQAIENYQRAYNIRTRENDFKAVASTLNRIAFAYSMMNNFEEALEYYTKSLQIRIETNDISGLPWSYIGIAGMYQKYNLFTEAIHYFQKAIEPNSILSDKRCLLHCYIGLGKIYVQLFETEKAFKYINDAFEIATHLKAKPLLYEIHFILSELYQSMNNHEKGLFHYKEYHVLKEQVLNVELQNRLKYQQINFAIENAKKEAEIYQLKHVQLKQAYQILESKNNEITDSINYAKRIQLALLPPGDYINSLIPERFILYMPRDIVSGDFYWITEKEGKTIIAAADCTGHGVPGAFMSMLGMALLNDIVNKQKILNSNDILNNLRNEIIVSLHQTGRDDEPKDGMDIAFCIIDNSTLNMQFSGANNPLFLFRNRELIIYEHDKMPIGIHIRQNEPFTRHEIQLQKNDTFYIFSDGYASQFGGPENRKFMIKRFKEYLTEIHTQPIIEQQEKLEKTLLEWQGENFQVDDILVIGVKI